MKSVSQFFSYLNDVDFPYVVLRNWDNLPYSVELGQHSDLDLLVYDLDHFLEVIKEAVPEFPLPRVRFKVPIDDTNIFCDVRHTGDGYFPEDFQKNVLATKEWNARGFWTPNPIHHQIGLAYHAVHHKGHNVYQRWLGKATIPELLDALQKSSIGWVPPDDPTVGRYNIYWKGATSVVSKQDGMVVKRQKAFMEHDLIANEFRILSVAKSPWFCKLLGEIKDDHSIILEDCGEHLRPDNLPDDWKGQLENIIRELKNFKIIHRDVRPDNLVVKDGVIRLIDFGWARFSDDAPDNPPECLGFPYKPSYGFDDAFSMKTIIKQLEYLREESNENISDRA